MQKEILFLIITFLFVNCSRDNNPLQTEDEPVQIVDRNGWQLLGLENERVSAIAVDPDNPEIIYAGTKSDYSAGINGKLYKSTDGGTTWGTILVGGSYKNIIIDPHNSDIIYAMPFSIIKSYDAGKTWQPIIEGIKLDWETRVQSLAINPKNSNVLYAGTGGFYGGDLYKSHDGGLHWNKTPTDCLIEGVISIAINPVDTNIVYVGTAMSCFVWKSNDAGESWFNMGLGGELNHDICISMYQPSIVYTSTRGVFESMDGGMNWENISIGLPSERFQAVKIQQSNSSRLFINVSFGDDGGIYEYSFEQKQWERIGIDIDNLHISYYYSELKYYPNPDRLYFGGKGIYIKLFHY